MTEKKFIPFEKLSKKEKAARNKEKRGSWLGLNPVTRTPPNPKAYDRSRFKNGGREEE